jgi:hypothetical protein
MATNHATSRRSRSPACCPLPHTAPFHRPFCSRANDSPVVAIFNEVRSQHPHPVCSCIARRGTPNILRSYWDGADLREKLKPVGYMKLKRYLTLNGVECGNTLLKDELVTLAILHRGRINLDPLLSTS